ncbi:hypothetical protein HY333_01760 [Candidatus Collierbacteria bacterium]|nr:hypothetical protein [Candidatus Collierbacteria bacterium]
MPIVVKKKQGQSQQQLINEFKRLTFEDPGLERVKEVAMKGYQKPSQVRKVKKDMIKKELARIRRRNKANQRGK